MKGNYIIGRFLIPAFWVLALLNSCGEKRDQQVPLEEIAANEEVLDFMRTFDGRGALSDSTDPLSPEVSLSSFRIPDDLKLELILAEPKITQPLFMDFDHRGRLWVVQYNQYPYPRDLKITAMDHHIRATFDRVPPPPGQGPEGADKITFFEDSDGDGVYDKSTDAITGLNIATSVAIGRGHIWVLNPPYLVAYPDADDNGLPDGPPVVHLNGFGIEDTHAVANSLRWGPDGWLYGAQGSTCTANITSAVSKNIKFAGQAIWRYHPASMVFEVFAEGGGNTFDIEIDEKGRIYSGDNGTARGQYYKQGAYYVRNFGKHGALTNPYAFGHLSNMELEGEKIRFTHAFIKYEGGKLPQRYDGRMIAINPLQGFVQLSRFENNGSTFTIVDEERIIQTDDHWFRPVDITTGPDGGVYVVDWYDSRLSHVDPRDTWSKTNGRIYRISSLSGEATPEAFNLSELPGKELIKMLSHENRWFRQQALRLLGDRCDSELIPSLSKIVETENGQIALEALWALNLCAGLNETNSLLALRHRDPFVRLWAVRLCGDSRQIPPALAVELARVAADERHPEVRSQLAATAKRVSAEVALPIITNLLKTGDDADDPDIPLQIWWALESKSISDRHAVTKLFEDSTLWKNRTVTKQLLERLMQRYVMENDSAAFNSAARLIMLAPSVSEVKILINGMHEGLRGKDLVRLSPVLLRALEPYQKHLTEHALGISLRQRKPTAIAAALTAITKINIPLSERLLYIRIFGEIHEPDCVPVLLSLVEHNKSSPAIRQNALQALQRYDDEEIGKQVAKAYPDKLRADYGVRITALSLLASRPAWARQLLYAIDRKKKQGEDFIARTISKDDVPEHIVRQLKLLDDVEVTRMATRIWPEVRSSSTLEKNRKFSKVLSVLEEGAGNIAGGRKIFIKTCGPCHRLHRDGGTLGPDLTGYDRRNVSDLLNNIIDPAAYVREGYVTYRITTADGRIISGNVAGREGNMMMITLLSGDSITLPEKEISDMQAQPSIMPDNLLDNLSNDQIRDLFAYITK